MTWRRAQMILLSAQGMEAARIAQVTWLNRIEAQFTTLRYFQPPPQKIIDRANVGLTRH